MNFNPAKVSQYLLDKFLSWSTPAPTTPAVETQQTTETPTPTPDSTDRDLALINALKLLRVLSSSTAAIEDDLTNIFEEFKKEALMTCPRFRVLSAEFFSFANAIPLKIREELFTDTFLAQYNQPNASPLNKYNALYNTALRIKEMQQKQEEWAPTISSSNAEANLDEELNNDPEDEAMRQAIENSLADMPYQPFPSYSSTSSSSSSSSSSRSSVISQAPVPDIPSITTTTTTNMTTATTSNASTSKEATTISNEALDNSASTMIFSSKEEERFEMRLNMFIPQLFGNNSNTNEDIKAQLKKKWTSYKSQYQALIDYEKEAKKSSSLEALTQFLENYQPAAPISGAEKRKAEGDSKTKQQPTQKRGKH